MGTWGMGAFDNDVAGDWLEDLADSDPIAFFRHCLDLSDQDYLEQVACVGVVCTAEILHGLLRSPRPELPETACRWIADHSTLMPFELVPAAIDGMEAVLDEPSEMRELWEDEAEHYAQWQAYMAQLTDGLRQVIGV
ncbi:MAG: DUF4259 domain-containing protein [Pirellulales bacterium]|nr:DUF4259 domain-containing protein [Pirellulales bacterium]